jgi:cob(I)alamin adenosyltransferase
MKKGYIQIYTGNGKGKTTAALGLALRGAGSGEKSIFIQFMKGQHYGELNSSKMLNGLISIEQYGSDKFCTPDGENFNEHFSLAKKGLKRTFDILKNNSCSILILDEIITSLMFDIISIKEIIDIIKLKPESMELVLTGRNAPKELIDIADLVTEMKEIKHYYQNGVQAREGIEF